MVLEEVAECPVCSGVNFVPHLVCTDFTATHEAFPVKHCTSCGVGITSPRPTEINSGRYYESEKYISHTASSRGLFDSIYFFMRSFTTRWKYSLVKPYLKEGGLLDYGCGTGAFLREVKKHGHVVYGVEPSIEARKSVGNLAPTVATIKDLPATSFDVITLWHVLEHVYDLSSTIQQLRARLTENGVLFIAVPNHESHDAMYYGKYWAAYDVPRHIWHFTKSSMAVFLQKEGLSLIETIPMKLDAFYVSLLSEQYRSTGPSGVKGILRATRQGLISNFKGRTKTNQSSLIFVVKKK